MANRYWVGTGSWTSSNTANWSTTSGGATGASVPTSADAVFFDANSGQCTMGSGLFAASITCTGYTNAWQGASAANTTTVSGNITLASTMTQSTASTFVIAATATIISAGKQFNSLTVNASGGTVTLGDAFNVTDKFTVTNGTFTTSASNYSVSVGSFLANTVGTRTITLNASTVTVTGYNTSFPFDLSGSTVTFNAGTSTISISAAGSMNIYMGGKTFNNFTFTNTSPVFPTGPVRVNNTFTVSGTLTLSAPSSAGARIYSFDDSITNTVGTLVASGSSTTQRIRIVSGSDGTKTTLSVGTWTTKQNLDFIDVTAAGASSPWSGTSIGVVNVSNITGSTAKTVYWNLAGVQSWEANGWAASSGGAPATSNFPLAQDTAVFDNTGSAGTVTIDTQGIIIPTISSLGRTSAMTLNLQTDASFYGASISFGTGVTVSGGGGIYMFNRTATTITSSVTLSNTGGIINYGAGFILGNALTMSGYLIINTGANVNTTFNTAGYNLTADRVTISNFYSTTTLTLSSSTITLTGTSGWNMVTSSTINANTATISLTSAGPKTFAGRGLNYNGLTLNQGGGGALTISGGNTFGNITNTYSATGATTITFPAATTNTFSNWNANGSAGKLLTINSTSTAATVSKSSGVVSADYLSISNSTATGGATWYAGANSTNGGGNTGWIFSAAPGASSSNFLMFF